MASMPTLCASGTVKLCLAFGYAMTVTFAPASFSSLANASTFAFGTSGALLRAQ
jgi:hypothetical protein